MTDLTQLLAEIQKTEKSHVDLYKRRVCGTLQWFLEHEAKTHPIHNNNDLQFFMCGQEGFAAIERDIRAATRSIDLVLWGFDPGMELVRKGSTWPRGTTYGDLLIAKAREGVKVRLLLWYDGDIPYSEKLFFYPLIGGHLITASGGYVPGVNPIATITGNVPDIGAMSGIPWPASKKGLITPLPASNGRSDGTTLIERSNYCGEWWTQALRGSFTNLEIRLRKMHPKAVMSNTQKYLPDAAKSFSESRGMRRVGTHHQKPVLIDYGLPGKDGKKHNTCAYVMGLNSVTDYWDTERHLYNDKQRELSPASGTVSESSMWYLKPYRDYAIRVEGEALYNINENFVQGWDSADGYGAVNGAKGPSLAAERQSIQAKDLPRPPGAACRAQIIRTFPDKNEATILKAYTLASSNAVNYIYVENQYFQLTEWSRLLKKIRQQYRTGMRDAGATVTDIAPLHVFVVIPQPERDQMVPSTYDTLNQLGQTQNMRAYDKAVREPTSAPKLGMLQRAELTLVQGVAAVMHPTAALKGALHKSANDLKQAIAKESADAAPANPVGELNDLGIKALAAMLMTYDADDQAKNIRIKDRDNNAQRAQAKQEEEVNSDPKTKAHQGKANDVDLKRLDECTIQPGRYREIYIHSKLMFVDDVFTTLGSANLNARSMVGDSEFNICTEQYSFTQAARKRVWGNLAGSDLDGQSCTPGQKGETALTHEAWKTRMKNNKWNRDKNLPPENNSFIHPFEDSRGVPLARLA